MRSNWYVLKKFLYLLLPLQVYRYDRESGVLSVDKECALFLPFNNITQVSEGSCVGEVKWLVVYIVRM